MKIEEYDLLHNLITRVRSEIDSCGPQTILNQITNWQGIEWGGRYHLYSDIVHEHLLWYCVYPMDRSLPVFISINKNIILELLEDN